MITKLKYHDRCSVAVEWLDPSENMHYAKLQCVDKNCKRKTKFVQWLSLDDAIMLTKKMQISQLNQPIPMRIVDLGI